MARSVSYVSAAKLVSMARGNPRLAIIDVRDEERSYQAHIAGSHHFASGSFEARMPELVRAASGKDTLVFHCALSQVPDPPPSLLSITLPNRCT
ncbi:Arsenate reductase 2.1 [Zea mays]|uniref:Dual specificity phosphatase Cdc25 n=2 Tax=Zea mays TaxID=4577 RepID=A0A1D6P968_MAIZE|nr:Dual specificity phosphatase Cdc25 [Zea mays]PWZ06280.1 Arsenate reductase 2.1 [Zea mays]